ncbi:DUF4437 domain-containing protein [Marinifaba aquimaris]|uniref:DUF4437 domain-containing protein n=1 Tax=Marinifaba aquimaris TaxID=2741323 RepID=UPI003CCC9DEF
MKLPTGFIGQLSAQAQELKIVVIKGEVSLTTEGQKDVALAAASFINASGTVQYQLSANEQTLLYMRTNGQYQFNQ